MLVRNPEVPKSHEGHHVRLEAHVYPRQLTAHHECGDDEEPTKKQPIPEAQCPKGRVERNNGGLDWKAAIWI